jgi:acetyl esterase
MKTNDHLTLYVEEVSIIGHAQTIVLRSYKPAVRGQQLPVILYFHGGGFVAGSLEDGDVPAAAIARMTPAWVISVGYSLSPNFPFPTALEDGYRALQWTVANARSQGVDPHRIGIAGHEAGGNLATCVAAVARDRSEFRLSAQVLLTPMLNPNMTWVPNLFDRIDVDLSMSERAHCYRTYLPKAFQRGHPYAAPVESKRLVRLPPALIVNAQRDPLHEEAERYTLALNAAGVPTHIMRFQGVSPAALPTHGPALAETASFFAAMLNPSTSHSVSRDRTFSN